MLQWLEDQVNALWNAIIGIVNTITSVVTSLWAGIIAWAMYAKDLAISFAIGLFNTAYSALLSYAAYLWYWIWEVRAGIVVLVFQIYNALIISISNISTNIVSTILSITNPIVQWTYQLFIELGISIVRQIAPILNAYNWLISVIATIQSAIAAFSTLSAQDVIAIVMQQLKPLLDKLAGLASDPVGYILAVVGQNLLSMLSGALAWGLGTTIYDLPPAPDYVSKQKRG